MTLPVTQEDIAIWLAEQYVAGTATNRLARQLTKLGFKKTASALNPIGLGVELGYAAGRELGERKKGKSVPNIYTKEIALYEQSALRGSRLI